MIIVHCADIHVHLFQKHSQYRDAFKIFYEKLDKIKPDVVVVSGDIAHNKTELSPEFVELCFEFLTNVSKRTRRLDLIIGNHNCNVKNKNRQNAISPLIKIINELGASNITLFNESGVYDIDDKFRYAVYSLLDDEKPIMRKSDKVTIGLFHGIVDSAVTDLDFSLSSNYKLDYFSGCDFGLIGDIHKEQKLDPEGRFRYPGSFIQQNIGESLDKGFLVWDIKDKNTFSVRKENIYVDGLLCSLTIDENFSIKESTKIFEKSSIRVYYPSSIDKKKLHEYIAELYKKYNALEVIPIKKVIKDRDEEKKLKVDFSLEKYLSNKNEPLKDQIIEIDRNIETKIDSGLLANRGLIWDIELLEFSNLFAYGEDNKIDFTKLDGLIGILGKNRIGKSSIPDMILWTLFNECSKRNKKAGWIVHHGKTEGKGKLKITTNVGDTFFIERKISVGKKKDSSSTSVDFKRVFNGVETSMNGVDRIETDRNIRAIFGTFDSFVMTSLAPSGMMNNFIKNVESERLNVLSTFLGSDIYKAKNKLAKDESEELKGIIKSYKNVDFEKEIFEAKSEIAISETRIEAFNEANINTKKLLESVNNKIIDLKSSFVKDVEIIDIESTVQRKNSVEKDIKSFDAALDEDFSRQGKILGNIFVLNDTLSKVTLDQTVETSFLSIQKSIDQITSAIVNLSSQEKILRSSTSILDTIDCSNRECVFIKDAFVKKDSLEKIIETKKEKTDSLNKLIESKVVTEIKYNEYKSDKIKKENTESKLKQLHSDYNKIEMNILKNTGAHRKFSAEIESLNSKIELAKKNEDIIAKNKIIHEEVSIEILKQKELQKKIDDIDKKNSSFAESLGAAKSKLQASTDNKFKFFETKKRYNAYERYIELTGRTGIPLEIIVENLELINNEIHNVLSENGFDFEVILEENEDKSGIELFMKRGDQKYHLELESSSEEAIASMAIRISLINICTLPRMSSFMLDEAFGSFDSELLPRFEAILEYIRKSFIRVIIISHIIQIKDLVDKMIEIERTGNESKVFV